MASPADHPEPVREEKFTDNDLRELLSLIGSEHRLTALAPADQAAPTAVYPLTTRLSNSTSTAAG